MGTSERVQKWEVPLSDHCVAIILFDGLDPDERCFTNLRAFIDLIERALLGPIVTPVDVVVKRVRPKPPPKPCLKHPDAVRTAQHRMCIECMRERALNMVAARMAKRKLSEVS